jgi:hypothetical protein
MDAESTQATAAGKSTGPALGELQARMAAALLAADAAGQSLPAGWISGRVQAADALHAHRNTVLGALSHVLRQAYPAIDRLVGEAFFDRMAVAWARTQPPVEPQLAGYGAGFAEFVAGFQGVEALPFIAELARLEWQFDELARMRPDRGGVLHADESQDAIELGGGLVLRFATTLRVLVTRHPVAALREALLQDDASRVETLAQSPGVHAQALWRGPSGVCVRLLHPAAARCLVLLQAGEALPLALEAARGDLTEAAFMDIIRADLLEAGFTTLTGPAP